MWVNGRPDASASSSRSMPGRKGPASWVRSSTPTSTFLAVLALAVPAVLAGGSLAAAPTATAQLDVPGPEQPASVVRDSLGIPHVFAHSDHDSYFLVGWLHAQGPALPDGPEPPS